MMKSYCVKQKKQTECVSGSETTVRAKNGRLMMKCKCAECGITKTKFIRGQTGGLSWVKRQAVKTQSVGKEVKKSQERSSWLSSGQNILTY